MKKVVILLSSLTVLLLAILFVGWILLGPGGSLDELQVFVVPEKTDGFDVAETLAKSKFIKNESVFSFLLEKLAKGKEVKSGGYRLSQNMTAWEVFTKITGSPDLVWVTISFCPRKEQVGEKLASALGWSEKELTAWNTVYTTTKPEYFEGVYYPDTYLVPIDETGDEVAERLINRFNEKFAPFADQFLAKDIKWTTGLKIASLIAREAGGVDDMKIISGVIWNRLDLGMPLQIDATMQYTVGKNDNRSWWGAIDLAEKQRDSPYNSYLYKGLPPTPICSPNTDAIEAALNPAETECLFYLHDADKQIHCSDTYDKHKANIQKYLKSV